MANLPAVSVGTFTEIIEMQFKEGNKRPIFGLGKGGIGKTESIAKLAKNLGVGYIDIRLLMYTESDLKGIPYPDQGHEFTIWLQNKILPRVEKDGEKGILVLDEITSVAKSVRTAAYQLLNERALGEYKLPDGWLIVCLGNGEEDGGDFQGMEGNFANRCSVYNVVPNLEAWKEWAFGNNINYLVTAYVSWRPNHLHTFNPDDDSDILFASPRSWEAISDILNRNSYDRNDEVLHARILANLGTLVGNQFTAFCKFKDNAIDPMDILTGKEVETRQMNMEVMFLTMQGVIKLMGDSIEHDKINNGGLIADATIDKCANGVRWILSLNSMEHQVMGIKDFAATDRQVVTQMILSPTFAQKCPELISFAKDNVGIFKR